MYTKLEDQKQAKKVMEFIHNNPHCIRKEIIKHCIINSTRLKYLEAQGLIKLPPPLPFGARNGLQALNLKNERESLNEVSISM